MDYKDSSSIHPTVGNVLNETKTCKNALSQHDYCMSNDESSDNNQSIDFILGVSYSLTLILI